jgi:peptidoglycan/LPS O-acetylase OafA/YrhL/SAM-dependent methyltransferase
VTALPTTVSGATPLHAAGVGRRVPALDGIRGLAILLVMLCHFTDGAEHGTSIGQWLLQAAGAGWIGVDLFFVLSGFLITGILFDARNDPHYFRNFYMRRVLRIFPLYYGVLLLVLVALPLIRGTHPADALGYANQWWLWTYLSNFAVAREAEWIFDVGGLRLGHLWSLAIEEQFYMIWPAVVLLLSRRALMGVCVACIVGALGIRVAMLSAEAHPIAVYVLTFCRMDGLAAGSLLALAVRSPGGVSRLVPWARIGFAASGAFLLSYFVINFGFSEYVYTVQTLGFSALVLLFTSLLLLVISSPPHSLGQRLFTMAPLTWLGTYSYGLYVFHVMLLPVFDQVFAIDRLSGIVGSQTLALGAHVALCAAVSITLAYASWHLYEKRFIGLKRHFEYREERGHSMATTTEALMTKQTTPPGGLGAAIRSLGRAIIPSPLWRSMRSRVLKDRYIPEPGHVNFGHLRRTDPINRGWGFERGLPIDRYYIEQFLTENAQFIQGTVLEIGDDTYTRQFGGDRVARAEVLHVEEGNPLATYVGDITSAGQIPDNRYDCVVLTQTLQLVYDLPAAVRTVHRILKPGGVVLCTVPGITHVLRGETVNWGEYWCWSFTSSVMRRLFGEHFQRSDMHIATRGNVLAVTSFLHGLSSDELSRQELDRVDPNYEMIITVRASKAVPVTRQDARQTSEPRADRQEVLV